MIHFNSRILNTELLVKDCTTVMIWSKRSGGKTGEDKGEEEGRVPIDANCTMEDNHFTKQTTGRKLDQRLSH